MFNLDGTPELDVAGEFTLDVSSDITLDADGGDIFLKDAGVTAGKIDVSTANVLALHAGTNEALNINGSGLNVLKGLRVGDSTAPTDNDIYAAADIEAANDLKAGTDIEVGNDIKMTAGASDWVFEIVSNKLVIKYGGTSR